jgi:hypothetical protein
MSRSESPESSDSRRFQEDQGPKAVLCAANLGPRQSARRLRSGLLMLGAASVGVTILVLRDEPTATRIALFPVWWAGMVGVLQARWRT